MSTQDESAEADRRIVRQPRSPEMELQLPSKEDWAAAQDAISAREKEQRRRLDAQEPAKRWVSVFDEDVPENVMSDFASANRVKARLTEAGIAWKERYTSRDCERMVADPECPGGWCLDFGSVTSLVIEVAETDAAKAKQVLSEKAQPQSDVQATIQREFQPRVIPSKESWTAAREEITAMEHEIGKSTPSKPEGEAPKAWRNYAGEDGWDSDW